MFGMMEAMLSFLRRQIGLRTDTADPAGSLHAKVKEELAILADYLPEQLTEDAVRAVITATISELGATSRADMGRVMGAVMPQLKGRADGKLINTIVQELLL